MRGQNSFFSFSFFFLFFFFVVPNREQFVFQGKLHNEMERQCNMQKNFLLRMNSNKEQKLPSITTNYNHLQISI